MPEEPQSGGTHLPAGGLLPLDRIVAEALELMAQQLYMGAISDGKQNLPPYFVLVSDALMTRFREVYGHAAQEHMAHKQTLQVLARVTSGELKPNQVAATDEGWQMRRQRPSKNQENGHGNPEEVSADVSSAVSTAS